MTNLVLALLETSRPLSLREIGTAGAGYPDAPGPLRQAFERDKRTLRDGGIPIAVERIDGDDQVGYRILPEQYYLADLGLDEAEIEAIRVRSRRGQRLDGTTTVDIAQKLGATSPTLPPLAVLPSALLRSVRCSRRSDVGRRRSSPIASEIGWSRDSASSSVRGRGTSSERTEPRRQTGDPQLSCRPHRRRGDDR